MKKHNKKIVAATLTPALAGFVGYTIYQKSVLRNKRDSFCISAGSKIASAKKLLILGDSVAKGYGSKSGGFGQHLISLLREKTNQTIQVKNLGVNGLTSKGLRDLISNENAKQCIGVSDLIIVNIGGNDLLRIFLKGGPSEVFKKFRRTRREFKKNLNFILATIQQINPEAIVIVNSLYNPFESDYEYYGAVDILIKLWNKSFSEENIILVNTVILNKAEKSYWADEVHPNDKGYKKLAGIIFNRIENLT